MVGDTDTYAFLGEAGDVVTIELSQSNSIGFRAVAELFAPGGTSLPLGGEAVCGPSETCTSGPLPTSGAYTILVRDESGDWTGNHTLRMTRSPCASDCQDGIDNDGNGVIDFPDETGCSSRSDLSERRECSDGYDNDGDGSIDFGGGDPGCATETRSVEDPECEDRLDNDQDGALDADGAGAGPADSDCGGLASDNSERPPAPPPPACGLGPELLGLAGWLALRRRR